MKGLLLKDGYTLIKQMKLFIVLIVVFSFFPGYSTSSFALVYAAMMPISALAYDERCKWDILAAMMPYTSRNIILSKYILSYVAVGGVYVITVVSQNIYAFIKGVPFDFEGMLALFVTANIALLIQAVNLPVMFKFGVEKGRLAFFAGMAVLILVGMFFGSNMVQSLSLVDINILPLILGAEVIVILGHILSIRISKIVYEKRDF